MNSSCVHLHLSSMNQSVYIRCITSSIPLMNILNNPFVNSTPTYGFALHICTALLVIVTHLCMYLFPHLRHRVRHSFLRSRGLQKPKVMMIEHRMLPVRKHRRYKIILQIWLGPHAPNAPYNGKKFYQIHTSAKTLDGILDQFKKRTKLS